MIDLGQNKGTFCILSLTTCFHSLLELPNQLRDLLVIDIQGELLLHVSLN